MAHGGTGGDAGAGEPQIKPYLVRAVYQWMLDCGRTPQIRVNAALPEVRVPPAFVSDDQIVLNLHPRSIRDLDIGNAYVTFSARFAGQPFAVRVPMEAVVAVFCRERGRGLVFHAADLDMPSDATADRPTDKHPQRRHLRLVE